MLERESCLFPTHLKSYSAWNVACEIGCEVWENGRTLGECNGNDYGNDRAGTALAGTEHHGHGSRADPAARWTWNDGATPHP